MGPTDFSGLGWRKEFCAREIADREGRPGLEFRSCSAVRKCGARRIGESFGKSCQSRRAIARRTRQGRSLRREDQLRVELGVIHQLSAESRFAFARARLACNSARCFSDQRQSARNGSIRVRPSLEREYSTFGGTTGKTLRSTRPSRSRLRRVWVSIFCEIPPISRWSSA